MLKMNDLCFFRATREKENAPGKLQYAQFFRLLIAIRLCGNVEVSQLLSPFRSRLNYSPLDSSIAGKAVCKL